MKIKKKNAYLVKLLITKNLLTFLAYKMFWFQMDTIMLLQISLLREFFVAIIMRALEWFLPRMNSKMIEEIMPLAEELITIIIFTFHQKYRTLCRRIYVLIDSKLSSRRNNIINFQFLNIEVFPINDLYSGSIWKFIS